MFIEQVMVVGSGEKFVGALIVPSFPYLREWSRKHGINPSSEEELLKHPQVLDMFSDLIQSFNKYFNPVEQIKRFELLPREWSVDTGELTPKLSLKRKVVLEKYADAIQKLYR